MTLPKVGRNDPCPCGSGKKYKNCHYGNEIKKTYTAAGKRKFKAKVITVSDKSKDIFQRTPPMPSAVDIQNDPNLKVKLTEHDYRIKKDAPSGSIPLFETNQPIPEAKPFIPLEVPKGDFARSIEDFRIKKKDEEK